MSEAGDLSFTCYPEIAFYERGAHSTHSRMLIITERLRGGGESMGGDDPFNFTLQLLIVFMKTRGPVRAAAVAS